MARAACSRRLCSSAEIRGDQAHTLFDDVVCLSWARRAMRCESENTRLAALFCLQNRSQCVDVALAEHDRIVRGRQQTQHRRARPAAAAAAATETMVPSAIPTALKPCRDPRRTQPPRRARSVRSRRRLRAVFAAVLASWLARHARLRCRTRVCARRMRCLRFEFARARRPARGTRSCSRRARAPIGV